MRFNSAATSSGDKPASFGKRQIIHLQPIHIPPFIIADFRDLAKRLIEVHVEKCGVWDICEV